MGSPRHEKYDVVIVGGGHNGLTAAAYLAGAGRSVLLLERLPHTGGAAVSTEAFPGTGARLSRYSYLVSLLPTQIVDDLGLDLELRSRSTASFTPRHTQSGDRALLVESSPGPATAESFAEITGNSTEYVAWRDFYSSWLEFAERIAPTLLQPLPRDHQLSANLDPALWQALTRKPLGELVRERFDDDLVRGVVATDALIGTFASMDDPSLVQNRCFLYHLIGNGTGEWRVPVGGMGAVSAALDRAARGAGAEVHTGAEVSAIRPDHSEATVTWHDGSAEHRVRAGHVLANVAPWVLRILLGEGEDPTTKPIGSQLKINFLLSRLPQLKSGHDPSTAFAGTFHVAEGYAELEAAYGEAAAGRIPSRPPGELYCHSLTDRSILGPLANSDAHTLTYFGLHMPADLFAADPAAARDLATQRAIATIDEYLTESLLSCAMRDRDGQPCVEAKIPQDVEADLAMPGGHIFHGDLAWPWASAEEDLRTPAQRWGVATESERVLLCGSGARRGGAVSGIGGHNAAQAVLESTSPTPGRPGD